MSRRFNIIGNAVLFILTAGLIFAAALIGNGKYQENIVLILCFFLIGAVLSGLINALLHELGHSLVGKKNGFKTVSLRIWCFKFEKENGKTVCKFTLSSDQAGATEIVPTNCDNLEKRYKKMTLGGLIMTGICLIIGIPPLFLTQYLPYWAYCIWVMMLPISAYFLIANAFPMSSEGLYNDGAVIYGINKKLPFAMVSVNLLKIQSELYNGKTPSQIDEKLYFDLPVIPEDDSNFIMLNSAIYSYYLDKGDTENAVKISRRLMSLVDDMPKPFRKPVMIDALYNACTIDYSENDADDLMDSLEKTLNNDNSATSVRVKLAYLLYVRQEKDDAQIFYQKGIKEASKCQIKGLGLYETKLLDKMKADF